MELHNNNSEFMSPLYICNEIKRLLYWILECFALPYYSPSMMDMSLNHHSLGLNLYNMHADGYVCTYMFMMFFQ